MLKITSYGTCFVFKKLNKTIKVLRYKLFLSQYRKILGQINFVTGTYGKRVLIELILQQERIGGFHAISGDTNNNGEMNKCWWTNKAN